METSANRKLHAVLLSSPGMGHIIPVIELGKRLVAHHGFHVTVFVPGSNSEPSAAESKIIHDAMSPKLFDIITLPPTDTTSLVTPDMTVITKLCITMHESIPAFRAALAVLEVRPDVLIVDLFSTQHLIIGDELRIPKFMYLATNAWFLAITLFVPTLDKSVEGQYLDHTMPLEIPGCRAVRPEDVPEFMSDRTKQQYHEYLRIAAECTTGDGILLNIWEDLQPTTLSALRDERFLGRIARVPMYTIGPLIRPHEQVSLDNELFDWLNKQPNESVFYVSLGSGGTLSVDQTTELAKGLELSGQRFIWVIRAPTTITGSGSYFDSGKGSLDMKSFLPEGFIERTQGTGLLVPHWAPQVNVLAHPAIGGFMSHCGWNSTMESIVNGVPMIAWPLYAEQRMNAAFLADEIGVAVQPKVLSASVAVIGREEIKCMVRKIMVDKDGESIRKKVKELKKSAREALAEGGSSYEWIRKLKEDCMAKLQADTNSEMSNILSGSSRTYEPSVAAVGPQG